MKIGPLSPSSYPPNLPPRRELKMELLACVIFPGWGRVTVFHFAANHRHSPSHLSHGLVPPSLFADLEFG